MNMEYKENPKYTLKRIPTSGSKQVEREREVSHWVMKFENHNTPISNKNLTIFMDCGQF